MSQGRWQFQGKAIYCFTEIASDFRKVALNRCFSFQFCLFCSYLFSHPYTQVYICTTLILFNHSLCRCSLSLGLLSPDLAYVVNHSLFHWIRLIFIHLPYVMRNALVTSTYIILAYLALNGVNWLQCIFSLFSCFCKFINCCCINLRSQPDFFYVTSIS